MISETMIIEIAKKISEKINPYKIILFGSYAYGTPSEDSDLDLCIIKKSYKSKMEEKKKIRDLIGEINFSLDILVPSFEEYEFYKNEINSVYNDIETRGKILWQNHS